MTPVQKAFRWLSIICALLAALPGYYAATLRWHPAADFDIVGILFVLQNSPRLTAVLLTAMALGGAAHFWIRSLRD